MGGAVWMSDYMVIDAKWVSEHLGADIETSAVIEKECRTLPYKESDHWST